MSNCPTTLRIKKSIEKSRQQMSYSSQATPIETTRKQQQLQGRAMKHMAVSRLKKIHSRPQYSAEKQCKRCFTGVAGMNFQPATVTLEGV